MAHKILVINPGSTSTKIAVFEDEKEILSSSIAHDAKTIDKFRDVIDQLGFRMEDVRGQLEKWGLDLSSLSAVIGRGGLLPHLKAGGYLVNDSMVEFIMAGKASPHASNLGAVIANEIAKPLGIPAYIYDAVTADEMSDIAKITGMPDVERESMCHVLNMKAVSKKFAAELGTTYEKLDLIVAHLGGGITVGVHHEGKIIDCIRDDAGPFSIERAGSIPLLYIIDMCYSGVYNKKEMVRRIRGMGGLKAYLGTQDCREIESMIAGGDERAKILYEAQAYQIAKGIGEMAPVINGKLDYIILTGGMAYSKMMTSMVEERVKFIAPVKVIPGENEMEALALGALRMLQGEAYHVFGEEEK